jgi:membrane-associated phospholipid phosphatase
MSGFHPWSLVTRLGEASLLLPCALLIAASLAVRRRDWRPALLWLVPLALAVGLTTASKIAFIGFGVGNGALDFTGISGHSMFATAVYPLLGFAIGSAAHRRLRVAAVLAGYGVALLVTLSRWKLGMHSPSECVLGFLVGAVASGTALALLAEPPWPSLPVTGCAALALVVAIALPQRDDAIVNTHELVTWVSLKLSGRSEPYTRADLHRLRAGARSLRAS